jgi:hypothetical protein
MEKFSEADDIYIGMSAAYDKLIHYYDGLSPMVGISLCLDPTFKKLSLEHMFDWKSEWVLSVEESFREAFQLYKSKFGNSKVLAPVSTSTKGTGNEIEDYKNFRKRKRLGADGVVISEEEYIR